MRRHTRQAGFTLTEMLIATAIMSIVTAALGGTFLVGYRAISDEAKQIAADTAVSGASLTLVRDLSSSTTTTVTGTLMPGNGNAINVSYGVPATTIVYTIDVNGNLLRRVNGGTQFVAARGLQSLALSRVGCALTLTVIPSAVPTSQTLNVSQRTGSSGCF